MDLERLAAIVRSLKGDSCAFHVERVRDGRESFEQEAIKVFPNGGFETISPNTLFGYASLQKTLFINIALVSIIDQGHSLSSARKQEIMKRSWNRSALKVLNQLRDVDELDPVPGPNGHQTTILQLLTHIRAFTYSQQHLLGPDGTPLMCKDTFLQLLSRLKEAEEPSEVAMYHYSNWNFVVAALIIEQATDMSLFQALNELVLKQFGMTNTIIDELAFEANKSMIAPPFIITHDGKSQEVEMRHYLKDSLELALGGGYSSVADLAQVLRYLMSAYINDDKAVQKRFFRSEHTLTGDDEGSQSLLSGLRVTLDSEAASSESIERALFGSYYNLGTKGGESADVVMKAGTVKGYSCRYYIIPQALTFVVVLTNSSGIVDPSLHLGQEILQQVLNLDKVEDIASITPSILINQGAIATSSTAGLLKDYKFTDEERNGLIATYTDEMYPRHIDVTSLGDGRLEVRFHGCGAQERNSTPKMRLLKVANNTVAAAPYTEDTAIDFYTVWRDFALKIIWNGDTAQSLQQISASSATGMENVPEKGYKAKYIRKIPV